MRNTEALRTVCHIGNRIFVLRHSLHISALIQQIVDHLDVREEGRAMQRRVTTIICGIYISASAMQYFTAAIHESGRFML